MKQLKIKCATPESNKEIVEWLNLTQGNLFDADILRYPTLRVLSSYNGEGNIAHLPSQQVLMLESLAVNPEATPLDTGQAFRDLVKGMEILASSFGIKEICFVCKDERVISVAESHGFERLPWPILRMKL